MNPILLTKTRCRHSTASPCRISLIAAGAATLLLVGLASSCSTAKGFGKDVEKTGDKIQEAASR